jgi:hypothetical protein
MRLGKAGLFGAGIYFATSPKSALMKQAKGIYFATSPKSAMEKQQWDGILRGIAVVLTVKVNFGYAQVITGSAYDMTSEILKARGYQSVKGRGSTNSDWELVVYDPSQILGFVNFEIKNPDAWKYTKENGILRSALQQIQILPGIQLPSPEMFIALFPEDQIDGPVVEFYSADSGLSQWNKSRQSDRAASVLFEGPTDVSIQWILKD